MDRHVRSGGRVERDGPMWRRDWPEGEDARRAVRFEERVWASEWRVESLEDRMGVEAVERFLAHSFEEELDDDDADADGSVFVSLLLFGSFPFSFAAVILKN